MSERGVKLPTDSKVQQHFKDEVQVGNIMRRFQAGEIPDMSQKPMFIDISNLGSFHESMNLVTAVNQRFMALPAKIRSRFQNSPEKLIEFVQDKKNLKEAQELGLARMPEKVPVGTPLKKSSTPDDSSDKGSEKEPKKD